MANTQVLAEQLIPGEGLAWDAARMAAANVLMVLCAHVAVPLPWTPVPVTGQTFGVMLIAALLGAHRSALVMVLYLAEGAVGLPVFQPFGAPGALRLLGPTAGYLWAYPVAAFATGWLIEHGWQKPAWRLAVALTGGQILILLAGSAWLGYLSKLAWQAALLAGAAPFVAGEVAKIALVLLAVRGLHRAIPSKS